MTSETIVREHAGDVTQYHLFVRCLHWGMALCFLFMWATGFVMSNWLPEGDPLIDALIGLHTSIGVLIACLLIARLFARSLTRRPPLPNAISARERHLALFTHRAFYGVIAATAALGWLITNAYGYDVMVFGVEMPRLIAKQETILGFTVYPFASNVHAVFAYGLLALAVVHSAAVIKHKMRDKISILPRIALWPVSSK